MTPVTVTATVTETGTGTATEIAIGTGTGTATEAETATETGTGPETAHHAGTVETAVRVGAVSSGTDPRTKSSGNKSRTQDSDLRASRLAAFPTLGRIPLRWTGRTTTKTWCSRSPLGLLLCGSPWLLATVDKGRYKICPGFLDHPDVHIPSAPTEPLAMRRYGLRHRTGRGVAAGYLSCQALTNPKDVGDTQSQ